MKMLIQYLFKLLYNYREYCFFQRDLSAPLANAPRPDGVRVRLGSVDDLHQLDFAELGYGQVWKQVAAEGLRNGSSLILAERDGRVIRTQWINYGSIWFPTGSFPMGANWANLSNAGASAEGNSRLVRDAVMNFALRYAASIGLTRVGMFVSIKGGSDPEWMASHGFTPLGEVRVWRLFKKLWREKSSDGLRERMANA